MAWSINVRGRVPLAGSGGLVLIYGDYSTVNGNTTTFGISGGYPIYSEFTDANNNSFTTNPNRPTAAVTSGTITTLTLTAQTTVTAGSFFITCLGG